VSRVSVAFMSLGALLALGGLGVALILKDRYLGVALLIVGFFLVFLPYTRPHVDE